MYMFVNMLTCLYKHVITIICQYNVLQLFLKVVTISTHPCSSDGWFLVEFLLVLPLHMNDQCFLQIL